jgi:hypothetical protein
LYDAKPCRGAGEIAFFRHGEKPHQVIEIGLCHRGSFMVCFDEFKRYFASNP